MDAMRYMVMALPNDLRDVSLSSAEDKNRKSVLDRLKLQDSSEFPNDGEGGVYGMGYYDL